MTVHAKDPQAVLDYSIDWSVYLAADEALIASSWHVVPEGELTLSAMAYDSSSTTVTASGGVAGHVYRVTNRITTSLGRSDDRSITIRAVER